MSRVSHLIMQLSYIAGVLSIVVVVLFATIPGLQMRSHLTTRGGLIFACAVFLCTIASYLVGKAGDKS